MAEERNTRREILRKLLTLGPVAALAAAFGGNGARPAEAYQYATLTVQDRIGVGTEGPASAVHAKGGSDWQGIIRADTPSPGWYVSHGWYVNGVKKWCLYSHYGSWPVDTLILSNASGGDNFSFSQWGYMGIGTYSPAYPLDVVGSIHVTGTMEGTARQAYYGA